jgi:MoxR-like ATPase
MNKIDDKHKLELINKIDTAYSNLQNELKKVVVGQQDTINSIITAILCNGNCLLIGVPGLAKTLIVKSISETLDLKFNRIQFTPDLMPADILGSDILQIDPETNNRFFEFSKGPIFANLLLADEINRTPPKTQSALLEAMQEKSVTSGGKKYKLDEPFFVLATQNPIEQEGTYPLPEAQLDRFMFSIKINYPEFEDEKQIIKSTTYNKKICLDNIVTKKEILEIQNIVREVMISDELIDYAVRIIRNTRPETSNLNFIKENINWGAGPRAAQYLVLSAKANAILEGRLYCEKHDIVKHLSNILEHRIILNFKAVSENVTVSDIINFVDKKTKYK